MAPRPDACLMATSTPTRYVLRALQPVELQPSWRGESPNISSPLLRIDRLQVVKLTTNRESTYEVRIFYKQPQSRIPTNIQRSATPSFALPPSAPRQTRAKELQKIFTLPDMQIPHSSAEFGLLRDHIHTCAQTGHRGFQCAFCEQLTEYFTIGGGRPLAFASAMLDPTGDASQLLTTFLSRVLETCQGLFDGRQRESCRGQRHTPYLLYLFLFQTRSE